MIERYEEESTVVEPLSAEDEIRQEETKLAEEKPVDANSEIVPNKNLTDDEIAQLILEEEELLSDKGLLGYISMIVESTDDNIARLKIQPLIIFSFKGSSSKTFSQQLTESV